MRAIQLNSSDESLNGEPVTCLHPAIGMVYNKASSRRSPSSLLETKSFSVNQSTENTLLNCHCWAFMIISRWLGSLTWGHTGLRRARHYPKIPSTLSSHARKWLLLADEADLGWWGFLVFWQSYWTLSTENPVARRKQQEGKRLGFHSPPLFLLPSVFVTVLSAANDRPPT